MMRKQLLSALGACVLVTGCVAPQGPVSTTGGRASLAPTGDPVMDNQAKVLRTPARDRLLVENRLALEALRQGRFEEAKRLLDGAVATLNGLTVAGKGDKQARSMFSAEDKKTFRGEPYERVMAYYYRGILYWMDGEPDNARACFRSAQIQDADSENKTYAGDYALLDYLDGLASFKLGDDGSDAYNRALKTNRSGPLPAYDKKANVLFFVEFGAAPVKYATGEHKQELRFRNGHSPVQSAEILIGNQVVAARPVEDLLFQATTRGGRVMDHILANKAVFKSTTDNAGNAAMVGGGVMAAAGRGDMQMAGLGLLAAGLVAKMVASAATPAADIRQWETLPQYLSFSALSLPPGQYNATVQFKDGAGTVLPRYTKTLALTVPASGRDNVVFVSDQSSAFHN